MSAPDHTYSRRDFVKVLGVAAGAGGLRARAAGRRVSVDSIETAQASAVPRAFPFLNDRARGWLRFIWEKATTRDDWTSKGKPHEWWDQYTSPGIFSYPRFDLNDSTYAILMMADQTPAWREVYTRIMDQMAGRYPTYWGAVDWLTQIGDDPYRASYSPEIVKTLPERLRGRYNRIGWVANGIAPYGLQPDPLAADGYLCYRGSFNLVLAAYRYISGDDKWERPFTTIGYQDQQFQWSQREIVERLVQQWGQRPEGVHCENTKIWPYCLSAAGLGLLLADKVHGTRNHRIYENWLAYCQANFMSIGADGKLTSFTSFYDPVANYKLNGGPGAAMGAALLILPQDRRIASLIYESAVSENRWNDPTTPVTNLSPAAVVLARELGDHTTLARLSAAAEQEFEPKFFGADDSRFGWWFGLNEKYPPGQPSALMMLAEVGAEGDWMRAFEAPHLDKFQAPTVENVDYPTLGISQAWNDVGSGTLHLVTHAGSSDHRGALSNWRVTGLPNAKRVTVRCDGQPYRRFQIAGPNAISMEGAIDTHRYEIVTGYRGTPNNRAAAGTDQRHPGGNQSVTRSASAAIGATPPAAEMALAAMPPGCLCCRG